MRITNSNDTTVQANFMGVGANNATTVANGGDGLLVSGSSANTQVGGVIPLGNVISGNDKNGIEVNGHRQWINFVQYLRRALRVPDGGTEQEERNLDHFERWQQSDPHLHRLRQSRQWNRAGGQRQRRSSHRHHGRPGSDQHGTINIPNLGNGIQIDGHAHNNAIGGFQASVEPQVTISNNDGYGIAILGSANDNDDL